MAARGLGSPAKAQAATAAQGSAPAVVKPRGVQPPPPAPTGLVVNQDYQPGYVSWDVTFTCSGADKYAISMFRTSDNALMDTWDWEAADPGTIGGGFGVDTSGTSVIYLSMMSGSGSWLIDDYSGKIQAEVSYYGQVTCEATSSSTTAVSGPPAASSSGSAVYTPGIPGTLAGQCDCAYQNTAGDPVNTATGAALESATDVTVPGAGTPFSLERSYRSDSMASGLLGRGWKLSFESSLSIGASSATLTDSDQTEVTFTKNGDGSYSAPRPVRYTLAATSGGYTVTALDNSSRTYDTTGRLTSADDASGTGLVIGYTTGGKIASVTDAAGRTAAFTEDPVTGLLTKVTLADGRTVTYAYTAGVLTGVTDTAGRTTGYTYDASQRLATITDPDGHVLTHNTYDAVSGRISTQVDASGKTWLFAWAPTPNSPADTGESDLTDPSGGIWTDEYQDGVLTEHRGPTGGGTEKYFDQALNPVTTYSPNGAATTATFDSRGNTLTSTTGGDMDTYTYDGDNNVLSRTDAAGTKTIYTYSTGNKLLSQADPVSGTTTFTYTATGQPASMTTSAGQTASKTYDADGNLASETDPTGAVTTFTYNAAGQILTKADPLGNVAGANPALYTTTFTYDSAGDVLSEKDPDGDTTSYTYDADGHALSKTDPLGHTTTHTYDSAGHVLTTKDSLGSTTTSTYDANGNLASHTDPLGNKTTYTYTGSNQVASMTLPLGNVPGATAASYTTTYQWNGGGEQMSTTNPLGGTSYTYYNAANQPTSVSDALGKSTTTAYDADNRPVSVTDPLSHKTTTTYDADGNKLSTTDPRGYTTTYTYDTDGNKLSQTTAVGAKTTYTYDADGRVLTTTDPRGNASGASAAAYTTTNVYDIQGRLLSTKDPLGDTTAFTYDADGLKLSETDALGHTTTYAYDADQRLISTTDPLGHTSTTTYDADGNVIATTDPLGHKTTNTYDADGHKTSTTSARGNLSGANAAAYTTTYGYDADGNKTTVTDPTGAVTTTVYDALNRPTGVSDPLGKNTVTAYDAVGNVLNITDPTGAVTSHVYDADRHLTSTTSALGKKTTYTYDADGDKASQTSPLGEKTTWTYDGDDRLSKSVSPRGNAAGATASQLTTVYSYDLAGNLTGITNPLGNKTTTTYDADNQKIKTTDPLGNKTTTTFDASGNAVKVTDPTGAATTFAFDADHNLTTRTDALGHVTTYTYDADGRQLTSTNPLGKTTTNTYDADGNLTVAKDARAITATSAFDARNLVTSITYSDNTPGVNYSYNADQKKTSITDGTGTRTQTFDPDGRLLTVSLPGSSTQGFVYTYNTGGQLTSRTYPDGEETTYTYDGDGHEITQSADSATVDYGYDLDGNLATTTLPAANGYAETRTYDDADQLTAIATANATTTLASWQVTLDADARPTQIATVRNGTTQPTQYDAYDAAGRLITWCVTTAGTAGCTGTALTTYTYNKVGDRTTLLAGATTTYTYNAADQLTTTVTGSTTTTMTYDADGNLTNDGTTAIVYDANAHPLTATAGGHTAAFTNDDQGNRVTTTVNGTVTATNTWDTLNALIQLATTTGSGGTLVGDYHTDPHGLPQSEHTPTGVYYDSHDNLGSVVDLTSATGTDQIHFSYDPYGTQTVTTISGVTAPLTPYAFAGQLADLTLTGTLNLRARTYTPATGRFTSTDPITLRPDEPYTSAHAYADDAPTYDIDPAGLDVGSSTAHDQASILAYVQLTAAYGAGNVYADLDQLKFPGSKDGKRLNVGSPGGKSAYPDLIAYTPTTTYVWEVKPANGGGVSAGFSQENAYVALLKSAGVNAEPGPDITPETWFFPTFTDGGGYWLSIFNANGWNGRGPSDTNLAGTYPGVIFYNTQQNTRVSDPGTVPELIPFAKPVKVSAPGVLPNFAQAASCANVDGLLTAAGLATGAYIVGGQIAVTYGGWAALGDAVLGGLSDIGDFLMSFLDIELINAI